MREMTEWIAGLECGGGEIYYLAEGEIVLSTLYYREEYDGCSRLTFERLLRDLYAETLSRSGT